MGENKSAVSFPIKPPGPPKVWKIVEIVRKADGKPMKFSIQEIPEDMYEDVVEHMAKYFIADEPLCMCVNGKNDPEYVEEFRVFWRKSLKQGLAVGAFVENPDGGKPIIAGVNVLVLSVKSEDHSSDHYKSEKVRSIITAIMEMSEEAKVYEKYGVDKYISAFGLSVDPSYRGVALGGHLLSARENIGREYNIQVTATAFTSPISQKLAARCGFETLIAKNYDEMLDEKGNQMFPGIQAKDVKIMAKRLY